MIWKTEDSLILFLFFWFVLGLRWVIFNGPRWGRTLLNFLIVPAVLVLYRRSQTDFLQTSLVIFGIFLFTGFCIWLAKWPSDWLTYIYKVVRGAAKTAKKKADAMAEVE